MVVLQVEPFRVEQLIRAVEGPSNGAVALFVGTVREVNRGRKVVHLEYHAYDGMARKEMNALRERAIDRFDVTQVAIVHRTGRLEIGEASVAVAVSAPHRAAAFDACRWVIDTLKTTVPIWKKEFFEDGDSWVEGPGSC
jgi:molybdopterin synthase catalytic subunit